MYEVNGLAEVIREDVDGKNRFRITRTDQGFLVTQRPKGGMVRIPRHFDH
jgi:hypothetical protein